MARIEDMLVPFAIFMIGINFIMLFVSSLPATTDGSMSLDYGFGAGISSSIVKQLNDMEESFSIIATGESAGVSPNNEPKTQIDVLSRIMAGVGLIVNAPSIILIMVNFLLTIIFGFVFWIDWFFVPLYSLPFGESFEFIALLFKGVLLIIQVIGVGTLFIRFISGFRK